MKQDLHGHKQYTTTGLINWVVDGFLVMTTISEEVKGIKKRPKDFSKRLVLGARTIGGILIGVTR